MTVRVVHDEVIYNGEEWIGVVIKENCEKKKNKKGRNNKKVKGEVIRQMKSVHWLSRFMQ